MGEEFAVEDDKSYQADRYGGIGEIKNRLEKQEVATAYKGYP